MKPSSISPAHREPNGRKQRPTIEALKAIERETRLKERKVVLSQPHRQGYPDDQKAGTVFGRFCLANKLADDLYEAGEELFRLWRVWRLSTGLPVPGGGNGTGGEPIYTDPDAALDRYERAALSMLPTGRLAVTRMAIHGEVVPDAMQRAAVPALVHLSVHLGFRPVDRRSIA
jgi:hypothetical protein